MNSGRRFRSLLLVLPLFLQSPLLFAGDTNAPQTKTIQSFRAESDRKRGAEWYERFQPYRMNYAIWKLTAGDQQAAEVQYSFKYDLFCPQDAARINDLYLSFTGKFDFYMFTRDSSPVINRTSNPAIHWKYGWQVGDETAAPAGRKNTYSIDLGVEHRSNGQVTDAAAKDTNPASPTFGKFLTQIEYEKGNYKYFDGISRDSNYVSITPGWAYSIYADGKKQYDRDKLEIEGKVYFTDDSDVTWGPYAGAGRRFRDYDLVRVYFSHTQALPFSWFKDATAGFEYAIGAKAFATDSIDLYLIVPLYVGEWKFPFIVRSHFGPMDRLADYTRSLSSVGFGLALAY